MLYLGINGFGRTGRAAARIALTRKDIKLVAINSRADAAACAYLLQYDSIHGVFSKKISVQSNTISVDTNKISCFRYQTPAEIPWETAQVDIVLEASGVFKQRTETAGHLRGSVKKVIISAPTADADKMIVLGVNQHEYNPNKQHIVSNASCTTNCLALVCKVVMDNFGINRGFATTIHALTQSQRLLDNSHPKDKRRGRTAFLNIVPTTTGATKALAMVIPQLKDKLDSCSIRVPVADGSLMLLVAETKKPTTKEKLNRVFRAAANQSRGFLDIAKNAIVSQDVIGSYASAIYDPFLTQVIDNNLINISAWYDNEIGYAARLIDLAAYLGKYL